MSITLYKNASILSRDGLLENGQIAVETKYTQYTEPEENAKPVKVKPSLSGTIKYVGPAADMQADEVVDLKGCIVVPALIDGCARMDALAPEADDYVDNIGTAFRTYLSLRNCMEALQAGVTTIKACGMPNNIDIALKTAAGKGMYALPSILATGPVFGVTAGKGHEKYGMIQCSGPDDFRGQVRIHLSRGLDGVTFQLSGDRMESLDGQFRPEMTQSEISAMVKHVRGAEKPVAVNASGDVSVKMALEAGVDIIQQGYDISEDLLKEMAEKGIWYVPCLVSTAGTELENNHRKTVKNAIRLGVKIAAGTEILPSQPVDGMPAIIRELQLLCELGMSPAEALAAGTSSAAEMCRSKAGILAEGRPADMLVLKSNPLDNINALSDVKNVICCGRIIPEDNAMAGGNTCDWSENAVKGIKEPDNYNVSWNLIKEI